MPGHIGCDRTVFFTTPSYTTDATGHDITGLSSQQIAMLQEIVAAFRAVSQQQNINRTLSHSIDEEQLKQLHGEFDWCVADVGVKSTLNRRSIYGIE